MEKLVGKVTYVRIPKLGKSYEMLGLTCIFENKAKSVLHNYNQMPSYQVSYVFRYENHFRHQHQPWC